MNLSIGNTVYQVSLKKVLNSKTFAKLLKIFVVGVFENICGRCWLFNAARATHCRQLAMGGKCLLWVRSENSFCISNLVYQNSHRSTVSYTCGPYGQFVNGRDGSLYHTAVSECLWNKTWSPHRLDPCKVLYTPIQLLEYQIWVEGALIW